MKKLACWIAVAACLATAPSALRAQTGPAIGPILAFHDDADLGIGGFVSLPLEQINPGVSFVGDLVIFFPGHGRFRDRSYYEINGDLLYRLPVSSTVVSPFILAGLNLAHFSWDCGEVERCPGDGTTDLGLNVGGGFTFLTGGPRPTVGVKAEFEGGDGVVLFGALAFPIGN